jgi:glucose-6-phosphate isomerase
MSSMTFEATGAAAAAVEHILPRLVEDRVASRLMAKDHTLWGPEAEAEAAVRLGWVDLVDASRALVPEILALKASLESDGVKRIVLCGMGGSSLAPEVITRTAGVALTVLDSTDPDQVRAALEDRLAETVIVVSSKSGSTVETDSQRRVFKRAFTEAGLDAASRVVVVTDPGSPLDEASRAAGYRAVFNADPTVGGRYSALTAFGLVPAGLAGVDLEKLLDEAEEAAEFLAEDDHANIGLRLAAVLAGTEPLRDKIVLADDGSGLAGFPDWAEQLIAESTGKHGTGVLPVAAGTAAPELAAGAPDVVGVRLAGPDHEPQPENPRHTAAAVIGGSLGSQLLVWEFATAVAGRLLGINPFDQPDVEAAKIAARGLLDERPEQEPAVFVDGPVEVRGDEALLGDADSLEGALAALLDSLGAGSYLSVQAYLDRHRQEALEALRDQFAALAGRPVTFGWGPRFLHSTGQFHKGGPPVGVFLQITGSPAEDLEIPDRPFTFGGLIAAQAAGDAQVLAGHGRPVLRLHLTDRAAGSAQLMHAVSRLAKAELADGGQQ